MRQILIAVLFVPLAHPQTPAPQPTGDAILKDESLAAIRSLGSLLAQVFAGSVGPGYLETQVARASGLQESGILYARTFGMNNAANWDDRITENIAVLLLRPTASRPEVAEVSDGVRFFGPGLGPPRVLHYAFVENFPALDLQLAVEVDTQNSALAFGCARALREASAGLRQANTKLLTAQADAH